ncbi:MAG: glycosyltransferase [bacterium]|nr:glycosyltransferase [bacterium]
MVKLSVIIVNYNVKEYLEQCLLSLKKSLQTIDHEIFVVDNSSGDGSTRLLKKKFPEVNLIENRINIGFSRANNIALKRAKGQYVTLLNPDTIVKKDTFKTIINAFEELENAGMVGCKVLNPDGSLQLSCRRSFPAPWTSFFRLIGLSRLLPKSRVFGKYNLTYLDPDDITEVDAISGSFMTIRKEVLETAGYLDEDFFMYGEDLEWCYRIKNEGWKIYYYPKTSIVHYKGESTKNSEWNGLKLFYTAMEIFAEKHIQSKRSFTPFWLIKSAIWIRELASVAGRFFKKMAVPAVDILFVNMAFILAVFIRFGELISIPPYGDYRGYLIHIIIAAFGMTVSLLFHGVYHANQFSIRKSAAGAFTGSVLVILFAFFSRDIMFSRLVFLLLGLFSFITIPGWRFIFVMISRIIYKKGLFNVEQKLYRSKSLIIGTDEISRQIYNIFREKLRYEMNVIGLVSVGNSNGGNPIELPVLGELKEINSIIKTHKITDIIFPIESHSYDRIIDTVILCQPGKVNFKIVPSSLELIIGKSSIIPLVNLPLIDLEYKYLDTPRKISKRFFDILLSALLISLTLPVYTVLKLKRHLTIKHKIIFGDRGRPIYIKMLMHKNSPYKGKLKYFPLWIQIFKGELSFVGKSYLTNIDVVPDQISLLKPGIIGIDSNESVQTSNLNGRTFELHYLKNYSILYDFKLILRQIYKDSKPGSIINTEVDS